MRFFDEQNQSKIITIKWVFTTFTRYRCYCCPDRCWGEACQTRCLCLTWVLEMEVLLLLPPDAVAVCCAAVETVLRAVCAYGQPQQTLGHERHPAVVVPQRICGPTAQHFPGTYGCLGRVQRLHGVLEAQRRRFAGVWHQRGRQRLRAGRREDADDLKGSCTRILFLIHFAMYMNPRYSLHFRKSGF